MYKYRKAKPTTLAVNKSYVGESIEQKVQRIITNKEPIKDTAPITYTERKEGVLPQYNIRTDRAELMVEATDKLSKQKLAKRQELQKPTEDRKVENKVIPRAGGTDNGAGGADGNAATSGSEGKA